MINIRKMPQQYLMGMIQIISDVDISELNELDIDIDNLTNE